MKSPKVHLLDSGLTCHLLGIDSAAQLARHPLRGAIFESWVVSETAKSIYNLGEVPRLSHYRDAAGLEVDLIVERGGRTRLVEMKSGATYASDFADSVRELAAALREGDASMTVDASVVYGGDARFERSDVTVYPWSDASEFIET